MQFPPGTHEALDDLDRQWGPMYDIAVARVWIAQRLGSQQWITASTADQLRAQIAADNAARPVPRWRQP